MGGKVIFDCKMPFFFLFFLYIYIDVLNSIFFLKNICIETQGDINNFRTLADRMIGGCCFKHIRGSTVNLGAKVGRVFCNHKMLSRFIFELFFLNILFFLYQLKIIIFFFKFSKIKHIQKGHFQP